MKPTFEELGREIGFLTDVKNNAYGSSFEKCGEFLQLLYPAGIPPHKLANALLLVRIFDKQMRIATDEDALGESPFADIAGYGLLGTRLHQEKKGTWQGSVNAQAAQPSSSAMPASAEPLTRTPTTTKANEPNEPPPSPQPASSSPQPTDATAKTAEENVSANEGALARQEGRDLRQVVVSSWCRAAFGDFHADSIEQRGLRLMEEAAEAAQASGVGVHLAHRVVDYVWNRPEGSLFQELGGVAVTLHALASAAGINSEDAEITEVVRVLSKPLSHFAQRNKQKNDDGLRAGAL